MTVSTRTNRSLQDQKGPRRETNNAQDSTRPDESSKIKFNSRRQRQRHPKVRSGCVTCKRRHVKCDESRPHCLRCTRSDHPCEGYKETDAMSLWLIKPVSMAPKLVEEDFPVSQRLIEYMMSPSKEPPVPDPIGLPPRFNDAQQYVRDVYSFGGMTSVFKPLGVQYPVLFYSLAWHGQCELEVMRASPDSPTSVALKGILLNYMAKQLNNVSAQTVPVIIMSMAYMVSGVGISNPELPAEYNLHFQAIKRLMIAYEGMAAFVKDDFGLYFARHIYLCCFASPIVLDPNLSLDQLTLSTDPLLFAQMFNANAFCENPFSNIGGEFVTLNRTNLSAQTMQLLRDIAEFSGFILSDDESNSSESTSRARMRMLMRRFKGYKLATSNTDNTYEACRLAGLLLYHMAATSISRRSISPLPLADGSRQHSDRLIRELESALRHTDIINLWEHRRSLLLWIVVVATPMSLYMPEQAFFKALLVRLIITYSMSDVCAEDVVTTISMIVMYQRVCEQGRWEKILSSQGD